MGTFEKKKEWSKKSGKRCCAVGAEELWSSRTFGGGARAVLDIDDLVLANLVLQQKTISDFGRKFGHFTKKGQNRPQV